MKKTTERRLLVLSYSQLTVGSTNILHIMNILHMKAIFFISFIRLLLNPLSVTLKERIMLDRLYQKTK